MIQKILLALSLIDRKSRLSVQLFALGRIFLVILDAIGVILIGLLITKSANSILVSEDSSNIVNFPKALSRFSIIQIAFLALTLFLLKSILSIIFTRIILNTLSNAESTVATNVFKKMMSGGFKYFTNMSSQDLIFSLNYSSKSAINDTLSVAVTIVSEAALLVAMSIIFIFVDFKIALGILVYFALVGISIHKLIGPRMQKVGAKFAESAVYASTSLNDSIVAYRELFTLKKQGEFISNFSKGRMGFAKSNAYAIFYAGLPRYLVESALMIGSFFLAIYIFRDTNASSAAGTLGVFLTGSLRIMASMLPLQTSITSLKNLNAQSEPFFNLVKAVDSQVLKEPLLHGQSVPFSNKAMGVKFDNVTYTYPNSSSPAVKNLSFEVYPGEFIALIGPSGAGKSTIADLLIKLIEPGSGSVSHSNSANIGYVPQSPGIVSGTILENITLNVNSKTYENVQLNKAIEGAHLSKLIEELKDGINSDLGAQSDALSGGQLQRIGLARALYVNPGILVLDEATSALDAEAEAAISDTLNSIKGSCTIVVIAHRLSTVQSADKVFVIEDGEILTSGKFFELAKSNSLVARYIELSQIKLN